MQKVRRGLLWMMSIVIFALPGFAGADAPKIGIVVMHGKGGAPDRFVNGLADELANRGYIVANLEMPWSRNREYDVDTSAADAQIDKAIVDMRAKGAQKIFVSGHSQGGAFAIHYGATHPIDGLIPIVPGGNPASNVFRNKLTKSVVKANKLVDAGKGDKRTSFNDFEGSKGLYSISTTPKIYLSWFSTESAMNYQSAIQDITEKLPVLFVEATGDYPGLHTYNIRLYDGMSRNKLTRLYEPDSNHVGAPQASIDEIAKWTAEVAGTAN